MKKYFCAVIDLLFACVSRTMKLRIPQMAGLKLYMTFIIYSTIIGFCLYSTRNVVRDLFYIVPTVLWIIIGYNLCADNKTGKSLLKTLYLYGMVISIKCVIDFYLIRRWILIRYVLCSEHMYMTLAFCFPLWPLKWLF